MWIDFNSSARDAHFYKYTFKRKINTYLMLSWARQNFRFVRACIFCQGKTFCFFVKLKKIWNVKNFIELLERRKCSEPRSFSDTGNKLHDKLNRTGDVVKAYTCRYETRVAHYLHTYTYTPFSVFIQERPQIILCHGQFRK